MSCAFMLVVASCSSDDDSTAAPAAEVATDDSTAEPATDSTTEPGPVVDDTPGPASRGYDLQGHRGARGLRPENTLPGFEFALDLMVDTLELDLHLSADNVAIVWHDPIINSEKCSVDGSTPVPVRSLPAAEITEIRCDRNPDPGRFPDQRGEAGMVSGDDYTVATLDDVFAFVETYAMSTEKTDAQRANAAKVAFNIETKRKPDDAAAIGDGFDGTTIGVFESAVIDAATSAGVLDRVIVQSFDHRSLWTIHAVHPQVALAALTRRSDIPDFAELAGQGATVWSPDYRSVNASTLDSARDAGLRVIPWTVNEPGDMADLIDLGVDGLITDRPDLVPEP